LVTARVPRLSQNWRGTPRRLNDLQTAGEGLDRRQLRAFSIAVDEVCAQFGFIVTMAAPEWLRRRVARNPTMKILFTTVIAGLEIFARAAGLAPLVEIEEDVYSFTNANIIP
jgi:hypothetical protein